MEQISIKKEWNSEDETESEVDSSATTIEFPFPSLYIRARTTQYYSISKTLRKILNQTKNSRVE